MSRLGRVFIDANILSYASVYRNSDVLGWINFLYDEIYIHQAVFEELLINEVKSKVQNQIDNFRWKLFDPDQLACIPAPLIPIYENHVTTVKQGFSRLVAKKRQQGRPIKETSNVGEIHSLAAAMLLSAGFICSNDYEVREVIQDERLVVTLDEQAAPQLITQDTIEDLCVLCDKHGLASKREVRRFFKFVHSQDDPQKLESKIDQLNSRLEELNESLVN